MDEPSKTEMKFSTIRHLTPDSVKSENKHDLRPKIEDYFEVAEKKLGELFSSEYINIRADHLLK